MEQLKAVIDHLRKQGVRFADAREHLFEERGLRFEDRRVSNLTEEYTNGVGIRVLYENGWGYASTPSLTAEGIRKAADEALALAKSASAQATRTIEFCEEPRHIATF
ncbi:MAG TPA: DNA gyrase modulator, partial [Candidatus Ozemobacteraceae bacterium]|nr:DNA gyrase modulator [Candidatus Ozemobacteraceae bacterium]